MTDTTDTPDQAARIEAIKELAENLFPMDGHETREENAEHSLFQLVCEVVRVYTIDSQPDGIDEVDVVYTIQSVMENLTPNYSTVRVTA